ncbi:LVIVD repeat-containing protein [Halomontanus rarus]|uniref:LVIVD repeat-containing protein n=1 Tax=Halomontanus rarus TaxID=3034020 RepID=UPI001F615DAD
MQRRTFLEGGVGAGVALTLLSASASGVSTRGRSQSRSRFRLQSTDAYEPLGRLQVDRAAEAVVGDDGDTVYLATVDGFAIVDVSDPADPTPLAERRGLLGGADEGEGDADESEDGDGDAEGDEETEYGPLTDILDVEVDDDRLVVPGPANPTRGNEFHGFLLYDVSDPTDPVPAADPYETDFHIHNCFFADDLCYLVGNGIEGNPLVIVDVSDDEPTEVGRWSLLEHDDRWADVNSILWNLHDVFVQDEVAYLSYWNAGTYLVDVSDPGDPEYISHVADDDVESQRGIESFGVVTAQQTLPGNDHYAAVDETGEVLGVGRESWAAQRGETEGAGGIDLWDISDRTAPEHLSTIEAPESFDASYRGGMWTTAHNFELRDGRLYSSWYRGGVKIHDVSDPASPEELAWWRDPAEAAFWTARVARPDETFVASSTAAIPNSPATGALYVFPIESGTQAEPPSLTDPDESGGSVEPDGEESGTGTETEAETESETETEKEAETDLETNSSATDGSDEEATPGFTGVTGLAGGALALEWLRRSRGSGSLSPSRSDADSDVSSESKPDSESN